VKAKPAIDLAKLRKATFKHSPDAEHDEWLKVGMQIHDATGGAQEGLDIWCEWSKGVKRIKYPGDSHLKMRYLSFVSTPGKHVATGAALVAELPAEAEEFPEESTTSALADEETTEALVNASKAQLRAVAVQNLESRLVFVHSAERYFDCERHKVIGSDNAIEHMFTSMMPKGRAGRVSPVKILKESSTKRFVDGIGFHPGEGAIFSGNNATFANTYRNVLPEPLEPTAGELERIEWLFARIDDTLYRDWLKQFFAHVVQKPGVKIKSAPLIWSETQGNGKTTLLKMIPSLLVGLRYSQEVTGALLNSDFNDFLLGAWHINLTEFRADTRGKREAITEKLKPWITDDSISIHPKGSAGYSMPNCFFVTATSNKEDAAAVDNDDRRWGIHHVNAPQFTVEEQDWIYTDFLLTSRAAGALRHYFLNLSLGDFTASAKAPHTEARQAMVASSISSDMELLQTALEQYAEPLDTDVVITSEVAEHVRKHCTTKPSNDRVGKLLAKAPFNGKSRILRIGKGSYRCIILRNYEMWGTASSIDVMAHIRKETVDITA
jgi:hypothetical protein